MHGTDGEISEASDWEGLEEISQRTYMHTETGQGHRPWCGEGRVGLGCWVEGSKVRVWRTSVYCQQLKRCYMCSI